jgi:hypothetical protein
MHKVPKKSELLTPSITTKKTQIISENTLTLSKHPNKKNSIKILPSTQESHLNLLSGSSKTNSLIEFSEKKNLINLRKNKLELK